MAKIATIVLASWLAFLTACGGGSSSQPAGGQLAGNWQFTLLRNPAQTIIKTQSGFLLQAGESVTGTLMLGGATCTGLGSLTGTVSGNAVSFTVQQTAQTITMSGNLDAGGSSMSGSYTVLAQGCGVSESGIWSAVQVPAVTGTFSGTLTSLVDGSTASVTATLKQGSNTGANWAAISGTITSPAPSQPDLQSPCFTSGTISGSISGTEMVWNVLAGDGSQQGQVVMTLASDPTTPNGKYAFNAHPEYPPQAPCRYGDHGLSTLISQSTQ